MKLLRNPIVVGVLGLVAVALVIQSLWPLFKGKGGRRGRPASTASTPAPALAPSPASGKTAATPGKTAIVSDSNPSRSSIPAPAAQPENLTMDLDEVLREAPRWAQSRRDPFQIRSTPNKPVYPRAMEVLTLTAIWRQTDSSLAVLNGQIYMAGDTVLRFRITSIEPDRVLVQGPNGNEVVEFRSPRSQQIPPTRTLSDGRAARALRADENPGPRPVP